MSSPVALMATVGVCAAKEQPVRMTNSGLQLFVSSMASFQRDGRLYERHGVTPDVVVPARPSDFLGDTDTQLDAAAAWLRDR